MILRDIAEKMGMKPVTGLTALSRECTGGYVSDLLSDVMANARPGDLWITLQVHQNIVAVASLKELSAIIIIGGRQPEKQTLAKAEEEKIPLLLTRMTAFEVVGELYRMGISGKR
jgi:predicted transcriptional regulator